MPGQGCIFCSCNANGLFFRNGKANSSSNSHWLSSNSIQPQWSGGFEQIQSKFPINLPSVRYNDLLAATVSCLRQQKRKSTNAFNAFFFLQQREFEGLESLIASYIRCLSLRSHLRALRTTGHGIPGLLPLFRVLKLITQGPRKLALVSFCV